MTTISTLEQKLKDFESNKNNKKLLKNFYDEEKIQKNNQYQYQDKFDVVHDIINTACDVLIAEGGRHHFINAQRLSERGYRVFCAESDSFGWLSGGIKTKFGNIYYG
ncbi:MAG: hypothetical protein ACOCRK_02960 [bacterium]